MTHSGQMEFQFTIKNLGLTIICFLYVILPSAFHCNLPVKVLVFKGLTPVSCHVPISMHDLGKYIIRLMIAADSGVTSLDDKKLASYDKKLTFLQGCIIFTHLNSRLGTHQRLDLSSSRRRPEETIPLCRLG